MPTKPPNDHPSKVARQKLAAAHTPAAIESRLASGGGAGYARDFVFGGIDGAVTTLAIVAGVAGAAMAPHVTLALGVANLLADGLSMAAGNYLGTKTDLETIEKARRMEALHIEQVPEGEREEVRQIFAAKGFSGDLLEEIVRVITQDRRRWIDTMLVEEHGLPLAARSPLKAGGSTLAAFVAAGAVPLLPYLTGYSGPEAFHWSVGLTLLTFAGIGWLKARYTARGHWRSVIETLAIGGGAAFVAYLVGSLFHA